MIPEEYKALIKKLTNATNRGSHRWNTTSDSDKFIMSVGVNSVMVRSFVDFDPDTELEDEGITLEIMNIKGDRVDGFHVWDSEKDFNEMRTFYEMARRNALRIDETISEIMRDLDS